VSFGKQFQKKITRRATRRKYRVKNSQVSRTEKPRISVFRSLKNISGQVIDDSSKTTLCSFSSAHLKDFSGDKTAVAKQVGLELGKIALQKNVSEVFFDRGNYLYHGRISAFAQGLRESGLKF